MLSEQVTGSQLWHVGDMQIDVVTFAVWELYEFTFVHSCLRYDPTVKLDMTFTIIDYVRRPTLASLPNTICDLFGDSGIVD